MAILYRHAWYCRCPWQNVIKQIKDFLVKNITSATYHTLGPWQNVIKQIKDFLVKF